MLGTTLQYAINIAIETTIIVMMLVLLITCILQRKTTTISSPFIFLICFIVLTLINQIMGWSLLIRGGSNYYEIMLRKTLYFLDYVFSYCVSAAFYFYVETLAIVGYRQIGAAYTPKKHARISVIVWGAVTALIYLWMLFEPNIYSVENGADVYSMSAYVATHIMVKFAFACTLVLIIRHRKAIGDIESALSLIFIILASVLVVADELCGLCISISLLSLFTFIIYVRIDLHRGLLLEKQEKDIIEWKTQIMLSQMQPHFLYNVFTIISSMCEMQNAVEARDVVNRFADYFRANLDSLGKESTIPFEKELEHIKTYLWLEKIRFEDALSIRYEIETVDFRVPSLTIQPIVENAVKHGILKKEDPGLLTIRTYETPIDYIVSVEDDGIGFDVKEPWDTRTHVGIENVSKRLEIICNGICDIKSKRGEGTVVTIHIPKEKIV